MDADLENRLEFFRSEGKVDEDLCDFVRIELASLADVGVSITDETAGMFATHLLVALQRVRAGEPVEAPDATEIIKAQLAGQDAALVRARDIAQRASDEHDVQLPPHEVDFVALHLASLIPQTQSEVGN